MDTKQNKPQASFDANIPCMLCKHLTAIGNNKTKKGWKCLAFPNGIPEIILNRYLEHKTILDVYPGQTMPYLFESKDYGGYTVDYYGQPQENKNGE